MTKFLNIKKFKHYLKIKKLEIKNFNLSVYKFTLPNNLQINPL
jgi:hypothetical protein